MYTVNFEFKFKRAQNELGLLLITLISKTVRHRAHDATRSRFEQFSTPGRARKTSWKQVIIFMCALT